MKTTKKIEAAPKAKKPKTKIFRTLKVYKYGLRAPTQNANLVFEQMKNAHKYNNFLIEIERGRRSYVRSLLSNSSTTIISIQSEIADLKKKYAEIDKEIKSQHSTMRSRTSTKTDKDDLKQVREVWETKEKELSAAIKLAWKDPEVLKELALVKTRKNEITNLARKYCNVYWGTYLLIEAAVEASAKKLPLFEDPKFKRWEDTGQIGVSDQDGFISANIFNANNTCIKIDQVDDSAFYSEKRSERRVKCKTNLHVRVGSTTKDEKGKGAGKPIFATFPMTMHRPLPEGSTIRGVKINLKKVGNYQEWSADFIVDMTKVLEPTDKAKGEVCLDIGWRDMTDSNSNKYFRMGKTRDYQDLVEEIKTNSDIVADIKKASDIRSIRDKNFDKIKGQLQTFIKNNDVPEWLKTKAQYVHLWKSNKKLIAIAKYWQNNRFAGDEKIFGDKCYFDKQAKKLVNDHGITGYIYHDNHLYNWECCQRSKALKHRKEEYRKIAAKLSAKYKTLILEDFNISDVSKKPEADAKEDMAKARSNKTIGAPSELKEALVNAFTQHKGNVLFVNPKNTSANCNNCGEYQKLDSSDFIHTCTKCKKSYDREDNATANIMKLWREGSSYDESARLARNRKKVKVDIIVKDTAIKADITTQLVDIAKTTPLAEQILSVEKPSHI